MHLKTNDYCCVCSNCSKACPVGAPYYDGEKISFDENKCIHCGKCIKACWLGAIYDEDAPQKAAAAHDQITVDCDFCVIGGGAAGLVSAVRAAEAGKRVVILEKGVKSASSAPYATGLSLYDTKWDKEAGLPSQIDHMIAQAKQTTGGKLNEKLIENAIGALPEFFDWCCTWAKPEEYFEIRTNPLGILAVDCKDSEHGAGIFVINRFTQRCRELGVRVLTETTAEELVCGSGGEVTGVLAKDAGGPVRVNCGSCLIATGSIVGGKVLAQKDPQYASAFTRRYGHRIYSLTGDGLEIAQKAGIPINYDQMTVAYIDRLCMPVDMQGIHFGRPIDTEMLCQIRKDKAVWVNLNGERWINEDTTADTSHALHEQPRCVAYTVMDHKILMETPANPQHYADPARRYRGVPGAVYDKPVDLDKLHAFAALPGRHLVIADTLEELAEKMEVPAEAFCATIARYNAACESHVDTEFGKRGECMEPVTQAPFYAFKTFLACDGAFGGLNVNENMQVLGENGPVSNLYAAGDLCSSYFTIGNQRKNTILHDFSWAVASGYLAGKQAAEA